jgi:hypothetical protein
MQIKPLPQEQNEAKKLVNTILKVHLINFDLRAELVKHGFDTSDRMEVDIEQFMEDYAIGTLQRLGSHLNDLENQDAL